MNRICQRSGVASFAVDRVTGSLRSPSSDELSVEEPLEIRVAEREGGAPRLVAVTMRTPGDDAELAAGFLFTEGIVADRDDLDGVVRKGPNAVVATLRRGDALDLSSLDRHSFVSSSCGACGKRTIEAVRMAGRHAIAPGEPRLTPAVIHGLPQALRAGQSGFARTGASPPRGCSTRSKTV